MNSNVYAVPTPMWVDMFSGEPLVFPDRGRSSSGFTGRHRKAIILEASDSVDGAARSVGGNQASSWLQLVGPPSSQRSSPDNERLRRRSERDLAKSIGISGESASTPSG